MVTETIHNAVPQRPVMADKLSLNWHDQVPLDALKDHETACKIAHFELLCLGDTSRMFMQPSVQIRSAGSLDSGCTPPWGYCLANVYRLIGRQAVSLSYLGVQGKVTGVIERIHATAREQDFGGQRINWSLPKERDSIADNALQFRGMKGMKTRIETGQWFVPLHLISRHKHYAQFG